MSYFANMATKVLNKARSWQGNMLSAGGRAIIIKHILQSQTLHIMAALAPPKTIMDQMEMYFANFFWGTKEGKNKYHWSSCDNMCFPYEEGGLGFKKLQDISKSFCDKRWWRYRSDKSLLTKFLDAKYCPRSNPISKVKNSKDSSSWRSLLDIRTKMEHNII